VCQEAVTAARTRGGGRPPNSREQAIFDLQVALLGVERQYRGMARRAGIYEALEEKLRTGLFGSEQEAVEVLSERMRRREEEGQKALFGLPIVEAPKEEG